MIQGRLKINHIKAPECIEVLHIVDI